ncbi:MAG: signal recognition particle protein [Gammaproteobacteria bacterium]|nr:signal recognition particle protein [Pseudomonadota bacterium]MCZ6731300.1 signal recognition particle protein [Gammaproteobacteria bacterium]
MFENLSGRLQATLNQLRGAGRLTEQNIAQALREVRMALLEADVALPVVKAFIDQVREQAGGQHVLQSLTPGQAVIKIVNDELIQLLGATNDGLDLAVRPPAVILMAGLQGSGKTTTVVKLARLLHEREGKTVLAASADVYRPAAIEQLERLSASAHVRFFPSRTDQAPIEIATAAVAQARKELVDVVLIDTAGRLHIDGSMMQEIQELHSAVNPVETIFVADSTTGQDAVITAKAFSDALPLTGIILTKTDGDARGGAALSIRHVTGKPIKFLGTGESTDALEPFHPDRIASRILGMGDVLSIVEEVQRTTDLQQAEKLAKKISKGKGFDLEDFRTQLVQMESMGGISGLLERLPGTGLLPEGVKGQVNDKQATRLVAMIDSMTPEERRFPAIIRGSRKRRIARGSGAQVQDVNRLLKQLTQMQKMMKRMGRGGMKRMLRGMQGNLPGKF